MRVSRMDEWAPDVLFHPEESGVLDVKYRETGYDCDLAGSFYSSDAFFESTLAGNPTYVVCYNA